jgi:hypothetical protein
VTVVILFVAGYVLSPVMLTWGWVRWFRQPKLQTVTAILSLLGFILASASALLAVSAMVYSLMRGGFPYYDPLLMKIRDRRSAFAWRTRVRVGWSVASEFSAMARPCFGDCDPRILDSSGNRGMTR